MNLKWLFEAIYLRERKEKWMKKYDQGQMNLGNTINQTIHIFFEMEEEGTEKEEEEK